MVNITPAIVRDSAPTLDLLDSTPAIQGLLGRTRFRPEIFHGDRAYGTAGILSGIRESNVHPLIPKINDNNHGSGLGKFRYGVQRTLFWFGHNRRLKTYYERSGDHLQALHDIAAAVICARRLSELITILHQSLSYSWDLVRLRSRIFRMLDRCAGSAISCARCWSTGTCSGKR